MAADLLDSPLADARGAEADSFGSEDTPFADVWMVTTDGETAAAAAVVVVLATVV